MIATEAALRAIMARSPVQTTEEMNAATKQPSRAICSNGE
jgi:hypothetical protein